MSVPTMTTEAIYIHFDLESSLGKIEDVPMYDADDMDYEPVTKTCEQSPFEKETSLQHDQQPQHVVSPYPIEETHAEVKERQRLTDSVGKFLPRQTVVSPGKQIDWVPEDLEPVEDPGDDEFSLTSEEPEPLVDEDVEFERIEDPVSFWESGVQASADQPNIVPFSMSYSCQYEAPSI